MAGAFDAPYMSVYTDGEIVQAVGGANITPFAEYNACYDALSLKVCLTAGFPVQYLVPGEINAPIDESVVARLMEENTSDNRIANAWIDRYAVVLPDYPYWDPVTAAAFLQPENLRADERYVTIRADRNDPFYAMTTSLTKDEYALLSADEQAQYGRAFVVTAYENFWDCAVTLLCR